MDRCIVADLAIALQPAEIFHLLAAQNRRLAITCLADLETGEEIDKGDLALEIAAQRQGTDQSHVSHEARKSAYVSLHQSHIPKLSDADIIEISDAGLSPRETTMALADLIHLIDVATQCDQGG